MLIKITCPFEPGSVGKRVGRNRATKARASGQVQQFFLKQSCCLKSQIEALIKMGRIGCKWRTLLNCRCAKPALTAYWMDLLFRKHGTTESESQKVDVDRISLSFSPVIPHSVSSNWTEMNLQIIAPVPVSTPDCPEEADCKNLQQHGNFTILKGGN